MPSPFRKILRALVIGGLWVFVLGGASYGGFLLNEHMDRMDARERAHTWAHIKDHDAAVVASDGLVRRFGQATAAKISPLGAPRKIHVAGTGREEWRFRYGVPEGPYNDAQKACVFVWKQKGQYDWFPHYIVVKDCQ